MRKIFVLIFYAMFCYSAIAQVEKCFTKGTNTINMGIGIGSSITDPSGKMIPPVFICSYEYGIAKVGAGIIGLGVSIGYQKYGSNSIYNNGLINEGVGLRVMYHPDFCNGKKYDIYGGVQLNRYSSGFRNSSEKLLSCF